MSVQIITSNGLPEYAVLPYEDYLEILAKSEGFDNEEDYLDYQSGIKAKQETTKYTTHEEVLKIVSEK